MPSDLQITNIRDQANANSAITIASDGQITVNQNNPTLTLGSNVTFTGEHHHYTSGFSNSWEVYNWTNNTDDENGIRVYRMGKMYVLHMSVQKNTGTGDVYETVLNLGSHITHPSNKLYLGQGIYQNGSGSQVEYYIASHIETNGDVKVRMYNEAGGYSIVFTTMMGMDVA